MTELIRRQRRRTLTDKQVAALRKKSKRYSVADPELRGMYIRIPTDGPNSFVAVARDPYGKQVWATIGRADHLKIEEARERAREAVKRIKGGLPAVEAAPVQAEAFEAVAANWVKRHVIAKGLRTRDEIERVLAKYVLPHWGKRDFESIKRSDVSRLLDFVEDHHGRRMADVVLSTIRAISNFYASRNDDYVLPFVRGMTRVDPGTGKRARVLDDAELRAIWKETENGTFGGIMRLLLLSGQRLTKVQTMKWDDVDGDGVWHIPTAAREKGNAGALQLPPLALQVINAQVRQVSNPYVFAGRSIGKHFDLNAGKRVLDERSGVRDWVFHDLRRTARSLMSRAGVSREHSERVLGHVIEGVEGIYDRHSYADEKGAALAALASLIERIIAPPGDNVRQLRGHGHAAQAH